MVIPETPRSSLSDDPDGPAFLDQVDDAGSRRSSRDHLDFRDF